MGLPPAFAYPATGYTMLSLGYLLTVARSCLGLSSSTKATDAEQLRLAFHDLNQREINDRSLAIQRVVCLLAKGAVDDVSAGRVRDGIIKILYFHGERSLRFSRITPPQNNANRDLDDIRLLSLWRKSLGEEHVNQLSRLPDAYLSLISLCLHPLVETPPGKYAIRFLDLSPLYGDDTVTQESMRQKDGRGLLRPDRFFEAHAAPIQPTLAALLILWNRNHNYIAHNLFVRFASVKNWKYPPSRRLEQDLEIFSAAKHINISQFQNIICEDVLKGLFSLADGDPSIKLDILKDITSLPTGNPQESMHILAQSFKETYFLYPLNPMLCKSDAKVLENMMGSADPIDANTGPPSLHSLKDHYSSRVRETWKTVEGTEHLHDYPCFSMKSISRVGPSASDPADKRKRSPPNTEFYKDEDIAGVLMKARVKAAGPPGGGSFSPRYTMMIELQALENQRTWRSCTFNTFRMLYGLRPLPSFEAWNPDPVIWRVAEGIYGSIDNLGLYVGLQCEAPVPASMESSKSGFGFGFTKTYALLVDLVTRLRSQPTPTNLDKAIFFRDNKEDPLTIWVSKELKINWSSDFNDTFLPKVLQRNLPIYFPWTNAYSFFLFSSPIAFSKHELVRKKILDYKKPEAGQIHIVTAPEICKEVFEDTSGRFLTLYSDQLELLTNQYGYLLGFDKWHDGPCSENHGEEDKSTRGPRCQGDLHDKDRQMTMFALIPDKRGSLRRYGRFFGQLTEDYIAQRSSKQPDKTYKVDITGDVINNVCTRWVCETLCDYPLGDNVDGKPNPNAPGQKTTKQMYQEFANLSTFIFKMFAHVDSLEAQRAASKSSNYLRKHIAMRISKPDWLKADVSMRQIILDMALSLYGLLIGLLTSCFGGRELSAQTAQTFLRRAVQANRLLPLPKDEFVALMQEKTKERFKARKSVNANDVDDVEWGIEVSRVVANVLGIAAVAAVNVPQVCSIVVSFYLNKKYDKERRKIIEISEPVYESEAKQMEQNRQLAPYIYEALRISQPLSLWRKAREDLKLEGGMAIKKGDLLFADFHHLHNLEEQASKVKLDRERGAYEDLFGMGTHKCPALTHNQETSFMDQVIPEVIKVIFRLPGLSFAEGVSEKTIQGIEPYPHTTNAAMHPRIYISDKGEVSYYPQTLVVKYDSTLKDLDSVSLLEMQEGLSSIRRWIIVLMEYVVGAITIFWITYKVLAASYATFTIVFLALGVGPRTQRAIVLPHMSDVQTLSVNCPQPMSVWDDWSPHTLPGGPEGIPLDVVFNSSFSVAHQVQVYDADKKDTKLAIYVDDVLRALSTDFELNKAIDCGDDAYHCYLQQFSYGTVVVPPGSHSVRVSWAGKELSNSSYPDLGKNASRRVLVKRDYCAPE